MKGLLGIFFLFMSWAGKAQETIPLETRRVTGSVRNAHGDPVIGATISLVSTNDTLSAVVDARGYFQFFEVHAADFLLTVKALGFDNYVRKYFNNDTKPHVVLPPVRLGIKVEELEEVMINRLRGSVVRGDTTEFWAADYIVRDFARLRDLLIRMEGITIDAEGSVFHNGVEVTKALFNNEVYFRGSVKEAIRELPADIVERIQIIDRAIDGTAPKQLQSEPTVKVMNVVTKADKSRGRMIHIAADGGSGRRNRLDAGYKQIDGADQRSVFVGHQVIPLGVKTSAVPGSIAQGSQHMLRRRPVDQVLTGGRLNETIAAVDRNLVWDAVKIMPSYQFLRTDSRDEIESLSEWYYVEGMLNELSNRSHRHRTNEHHIQSNYEVKTETSGNYSGGISFVFRDNDQHAHHSHQRTGMIRSTENETSRRRGNTYSASASVQYIHRPNPQWMMNATARANYSWQHDQEDLETQILLPVDLGTADSTLLQHRRSEGYSATHLVQGSATWTSGSRWKVQFTSAVQHNADYGEIDAQVWEETRFSVHDRLSAYRKSHHFHLPVTVVPEFTVGKGFYLAAPTQLENSLIIGRVIKQGNPINRFDLIVNPGLTAGVRNARVGSLSVKVSQNTSQPTFQALNPDSVYVTPFNITVGDPSLRNSRQQRIDVNYTRMFRKLTLNVAYNSSFGWHLLRTGMDRNIEIDPVRNIMVTTSRQVNISGGTNQRHSLFLTKTMAKIRSTLKYTGHYNVAETPYLNDGIRQWSTTTNQSHDLSFIYRIRNWMDITPLVNYLAMHNTNTLATFGAPRNYYRHLTADLKWSFFFPRQIRMNVDLSQSVVETSSVLHERRPFVVNANVESRILKDKSMIVSVVAMDIARQNAFIAHRSSQFGYTTTTTNPNSRYYMLQLSWQPQYWGRSMN